MKISMILDKIDEHQLFVPAFQREYVWKREDVKSLIDSLIKEYPTGTMLTWQTNNPPELKGDHKYDEKEGAVLILLDGQQRLTSLYMLIRGDIPPYYKHEEIQHDTRGLYINVETMELAYYSKKKMEYDPRWQNITHILKRQVKYKDVVRDLESKGVEISREMDDLIDNNIRKVDNIPDRDFPEQTIPPKATVREAIDIFYKVNDSGVSLSDAELALAQISGYWPEARDLFKSKLHELQQSGFVFSLDFIIYALLGCMYRLGSDMRKLHAPENDGDIQKVWHGLENHVLDYVINIMRSHAYVDHTKEINSVYALIPIIVYCYLKDDDQLNETEIRKIVKWFYYSQIRARYISQLPQKLDRDLRMVFEADSPFDELLSVIEEERRLSITPDEFTGRAVSHPLFGLMRWYFKSKGAICLTTGVQLRKNMGKKYQLEQDHIFPYSKLKQIGYSRENRVKYSLAQEVTNRAILTQSANRTKGCSDAKEYLSQVKTRFPGSLALQCIPEDPNLWEIENYELFLQKRRDLLAKELNRFLEEITETTPSATPISLEELIEDGEDDELEFKSSLRWDYNTHCSNRKLEKVVVKTVAAFANAQGGTLLIGVSDEGQVLGLDRDYYSIDGGDRDKFELHLRNILQSQFDKPFVANKLEISFPSVQGNEICQIMVKAANKPVVIRDKDKNGQWHEKFYVRSGNSSQELSLSEMHSYSQERFQS